MVAFMTRVNDGSGGRPASAERRAEQLREMKESFRRQEAERLAALERSRLASIEQDRRWKAHLESLDLDDIIEIPCIENGEKLMRRFHENAGKLTPVAD